MGASAALVSGLCRRDPIGAPVFVLPPSPGSLCACALPRLGCAAVLLSVCVLGEALWDLVCVQYRVCADVPQADLRVPACLWWVAEVAPPRLVWPHPGVGQFVTSGLWCTVLQRLHHRRRGGGALGHRQRELLQGWLSGMLSGSSLFQQGRRLPAAGHRQRACSALQLVPYGPSPPPRLPSPCLLPRSLPSPCEQFDRAIGQALGRQL